MAKPGIRYVTRDSARCRRAGACGRAAAGRRTSEGARARAARRLRSAPGVSRRRLRDREGERARTTRPASTRSRAPGPAYPAREAARTRRRRRTRGTTATTASVPATAHQPPSGWTPVIRRRRRSRARGPRSASGPGRLVRQEAKAEQDDEDRDGGLRDRGDARVDVRLPPRDERHRQRRVDRAEHEARPPGGPKLLQRSSAPSRCTTYATSRTAAMRMRRKVSAAGGMSSTPTSMKR